MAEHRSTLKNHLRATPVPVSYPKQVYHSPKRGLVFTVFRHFRPQNLLRVRRRRLKRIFSESSKVFELISIESHIVLWAPVTQYRNVLGKFSKKFPFKRTSVKWADNASLEAVFTVEVAAVAAVAAAAADRLRWRIFRNFSFDFRRCLDRRKRMRRTSREKEATGEFSVWLINTVSPFLQIRAPPEQLFLKLSNFNPLG